MRDTSVKGTRAKDVMNPQVFALRADASIREAAAFFHEKQITGAPVMDRQGKVVGFLSVTDIAGEALTDAVVEADQASPALDVREWDEKMTSDEVRRLRIEAADRTVAEIMTPTAYTIPDDTPAREIAKTMIAGRIHRLFVTHEGRIVGVVSALDLLRLLIADEGA